MRILCLFQGQNHCWPLHLNLGRPLKNNRFQWLIFKPDHQRWAYSTVERFEKIRTKIKEKNKAMTIFLYGEDRQ